MSINILEIANLWERDQPLYDELGRIVHSYIEGHITDYEILPDTSFRTKDLVSIIKKIKKKSRDKAYNYNHLNDKLGLRIICNYKEDLDKVDDFLKRDFIIKKVEYKKDTLDFDRLDYTSNHYDASININVSNFAGKAAFQHLIFEVQVRTLNQHAWSNTAHSLSYKQEADISPSLKRRVYRLLSLYEIADDEFSTINSILSNDSNNILPVGGINLS